MSSVLPVSVIIIAKNEAQNLPRCLESLRDWTREIVAVINDCSDDTRAVLESYGARVYEHAWSGFVEQKNIALGYARYDWVFSIDADEEVTPRMRRDIENFLRDPAAYAAASFRRKSWFMGKWIKHGDWYPDRVTRLFDKRRGGFAGNYLHERLEIDGKTRRFASNLLHYSVPSLYTFLTKTESFTRNFEIAQGKHKRFSYVGTVVRAGWKFFRCYVIRLGFLDGYPGLIVAAQQGYSTFFKYNVLLEAKTKAIQPRIEPEDL